MYVFRSSLLNNLFFITSVILAKSVCCIATCIFFVFFDELARCIFDR